MPGRACPRIHADHYPRSAFALSYLVRTAGKAVTFAELASTGPNAKALRVVVILVVNETWNFARVPPIVLVYCTGRLLYHNSTAFLLSMACSAVIGGSTMAAAASFSSTQSSFPVRPDTYNHDRYGERPCSEAGTRQKVQRGKIGEGMAAQNILPLPSSVP